MNSKAIVEACLKDIWSTIFWGCAIFWLILISSGVGIYFFFAG